MTTDQVRKAYLDFFISKNHAVIPAAPLIPSDDPTTLFTGFGMQQLVPYLKGETHPMGKRLVNSQPSFRAEDIDEVGDNRHTTFFEMLGNWSLGDYFKKDQLTWFWQFLTQELKLAQEKLYVTVYQGSKYAPKDDDSIKIWQDLGIKQDHIFTYTDNWWSRAGQPENMPSGEIGGPDSEVFFEFDTVKHNSKFGSTCHPNCNCGRFLEIGNSVFMEYEKLKDGSLKPLPNKNVDFGGGLERLTAATINNPDIFQIDVFKNIISSIEKTTKKNYQGENLNSMRIIADHLRASTAMINEGIEPSNKLQGYVLRRLIRRSAVKLRQLVGDLNTNSFDQIIDNQIIKNEIDRFQKSLNIGLKLIENTNLKKIDGRFAFNLFQTYGFPFEITKEILDEKGLNLSKLAFDQAKTSHQQQSRTASVGMFKGGLENHSKTTTKLHTTTHLLHSALRQILGNHVRQEGSNITAKRLRFDFSHPESLTNDQLKKIEKLINEQIKKDLPVKKTIETKQKAFNSGALAFFKESYPEKVSVYTIGDFSKEICGGPHVTSTGEIEGVKIVSEESIGAGKRRLYVVFNHGNQKSTHLT